MRFRKVDKREFTSHLLKQKQRGKAEVFLKAVYDSGNEISEVDWAEDYKTPKTCCEMLYKALKKTGVPLRVMLRRNHVYLVRTDMVE